MRVAAAVSKVLDNENSSENGVRGEPAFRSAVSYNLILVRSEYGCLCRSLGQRSSKPLALYRGPFLLPRDSKEYVP